MWPYPWTHVGTPSHLGHMDRVAATMPSQAHAGAAQEAPNIGQWEEQDVPLVRPPSCTVKGGVPSSRKYLPTYLPPYLRTKNPLCEDQIGCFKTVMRILMLNEKSRNWLKLVPYATYLMNNQVSSRTGFTPTELFLGRPGFTFEFPYVSEGNPKVDEWLTEQQMIADLCRSLMEKKRSKENRTKNRKRKEAIYQIGDWVRVHQSRFKAWPRNTLDSPYFGPFLVTDVAEGSVWIKTHPKYGDLVEVGYPQLKHSDVPDDLYDWEEDLQESLEAAAEDLAADPMGKDEELPHMEDDGSLRMPERDISLSRPTVPTPTAVEARQKKNKR